MHHKRSHAFFLVGFFIAILAIFFYVKQAQGDWVFDNQPPNTTIAATISGNTATVTLPCEDIDEASGFTGTGCSRTFYQKTSSTTCPTYVPYQAGDTTPPIGYTIYNAATPPTVNQGDTNDVICTFSEDGAGNIENPHGQKITFNTGPTCTSNITITPNSGPTGTSLRVEVRNINSSIPYTNVALYHDSDTTAVSGGGSLPSNAGFVWNITARNPATSHSVRFRVNDHQAYGGTNDGTTMNCGTETYTTAVPTTPPTNTPTPTPTVTPTPSPTSTSGRTCSGIIYATAPTRPLQGQQITITVDKSSATSTVGFDYISLYHDGALLNSSNTTGSSCSGQICSWTGVVAGAAGRHTLQAVVRDDQNPGYSGLRTGERVPCNVGEYQSAPPTGPTPLPAWFQGVGGDMRVDSANGFIVRVPTTATPRYVSLDNSQASGTYSVTPGIMFSGKNRSDFYDVLGPSIKGWLIQGNPAAGQDYTFNSNKKDFTSFSTLSTLADQRGQTKRSITTTTFGPSSVSQDGVYLTTGSITVNNAVNITRKAVILVQGNLTIDNNITLSGNGYLLFAVQGNIIVKPGVTTLHGVYSADNTVTIEDQADGNAPQLRIEGIVLANVKRGASGEFKQERRTNSQATPGVIIIERPDLVLKTPEFLKVQSGVWQEVKP